MFCYHCGVEIGLKRKPGRQETCSDCGEYLHCCFNCLFYDEAAHHHCREPQSEWVLEKNSANFCDYFQPGTRKPENKKAKSEDARKKLDDLFKS